MTNISFFQILIVIFFLFLLFGDFKKFSNNGQKIKDFFSSKSNTKSDSGNN